MHTRKVHTAEASRQGWAGRRVSLWVVRVSVMVSALWVLALWHSAQAAVFNIAAGDVSGLIAAITTANPNGEENTINLAAGTYTLTEANNDTDGPNGLPSITGLITIHGAGAARTVLTRDASAPQFRIVHVAARGESPYRWDRAS